VTGRQAMPSPRPSWIAANATFAAAACWPMRAADHPIGRATRPGLPAAPPASICPKALVNMTDWNCRIPSSTHIAASTSCSLRRRSGATQPLPAATPAPRPAARGSPPALLQIVAAIFLSEISPRTNTTLFGNCPTRQAN
jgi:hypothetical protein